MGLNYILPNELSQCGVEGSTDKATITNPNYQSAYRPASCAMASPVRVARTGRKLQRYENGFRLVAGCIPYRIRNRRNGEQGIHVDSNLSQIEVMMISSQHGEGLLFPKGGWESDETAEEAAMREAMEEAGVLGLLENVVGTFEFKSKRGRSELSQKGDCRAVVYSLAVTELLDDWPEKQSRSRTWLPVEEALQCCRHEWMKSAFETWIASLK